ncbi:Uncharacterized protein APZ42_022353 [Daphnia magna]|uniref:Uncharacterized protein n=1 Tax=Daphnia magna TaxID=35525 RepID=A0A164VFR2_9CRUS|nr:Uncharacterized protein APZ42_022353 [Daphnia magna]
MSTTYRLSGSEGFGKLLSSLTLGSRTVRSSRQKDLSSRGSERTTFTMVVERDNHMTNPTR